MTADQHLPKKPGTDYLSCKIHSYGINLFKDKLCKTKRKKIHTCLTSTISRQIFSVAQARVKHSTFHTILYIRRLVDSFEVTVFLIITSRVLPCEWNEQWGVIYFYSQVNQSRCRIFNFIQFISNQLINITILVFKELGKFKGCIASSHTVNATSFPAPK